MAKPAIINLLILIILLIALLLAVGWTYVQQHERYALATREGMLVSCWTKTCAWEANEARIRDAQETLRGH